MKSIVSSLSGQSYFARALDRQQAANQLRSSGTPSLPAAPRDVQVQPANGGVLVSWKLPTNHGNVAGWRVYLNTESNLAAQIRDKGTRQLFIPLGSGPTPSPVNVMVSSFTTLGRESGKVIKQGVPVVQDTATSVPSVPPGYLAESAGGADRSLISFAGQRQYIPIGVG